MAQQVTRYEWSSKTRAEWDARTAELRAAGFIVEADARDWLADMPSTRFAPDHEIPLSDPLASRLAGEG